MRRSSNLQKNRHILKKVTELFIEKCKKLNVPIEPDFAHFLIYLLARDSRAGLDKDAFTDCHLQYFVENTVKKFADPLNAIMCTFKLSYAFSRYECFDLNGVRKKREDTFQRQLQLLIDDILKYPETSNKEQLEQIFRKMQIYIVARFDLGSPKNHVLLKQTAQSLRSVIGHGDLQYYVLKKKYHRLEYLQRLSATVGGIVIYNNQKPDGEKENMREIYKDLEMAQNNTRDNLNAALKRSHRCLRFAYDVIESIVKLDVSRREVHLKWPIRKMLDINNYTVLFNVYKNQIESLQEQFKKTAYLITDRKSKMECVMKKIDEVLKYRDAIESEVIFPHFVYLTEVWSDLILCLNHFAELNQIKDRMDSLINEKLEAQFIETTTNIFEQSKQMKYPIVYDFDHMFKFNKRRIAKCNLLKLGDRLKKFSSLTIALTGGIIMPATMEKKLCENLDIKFGFTNMNAAKYAERYFVDFLNAYNNAIFTTVDLILLFHLEDEIFRQEAEDEYIEPPKQKTLETQTEMVVTNDLSVPNRINATWNVWDYHYETIRMADLRKRQTHSTQTALSYGQRNAQNQAYNTRRDV